MKQTLLGCSTISASLMATLGCAIMRKLGIMFVEIGHETSGHASAVLISKGKMLGANFSPFCKVTAEFKEHHKKAQAI